MRRLIMLAVACATPTALLAQESAPASVAAPADATAKAEKDKKICRRGEQKTGSIMVSRVCHTKEEWVQIDEANRRATEQFSNMRNSGHGMGSNGN